MPYVDKPIGLHKAAAELIKQPHHQVELVRVKYDGVSIESSFRAEGYEFVEPMYSLHTQSHRDGLLADRRLFKC